MTLAKKAKRSSTRVITWHKPQRHARWLRKTSMRLSFSSKRSDSGKNCYIDPSFCSEHHNFSVHAQFTRLETQGVHDRLSLDVVDDGFFQKLGGATFG